MTDDQEVKKKQRVYRCGAAGVRGALSVWMNRKKEMSDIEDKHSVGERWAGEFSLRKQRGIHPPW